MAIYTFKQSNIIGTAKTASNKTDYEAAYEEFSIKLADISADYEINGKGKSKLQFTADKLCEDGDVEYVYAGLNQQASKEKITLGNGVTRIFTKLFKYKYEFTIGSDIQLVAIDGEETESIGNGINKKINLLVTEWKNEKSTDIDESLGQYLDKSVNNNKISEYTSYGENYIVADNGYKVVVDNQGKILTQPQQMADGEKLLNENETNAYEINKKLKENIGTYVNYTGNDSINSVKWRIFNITDDNKIQIIADNYIPASYIPVINGIITSDYYAVCQDKTTMMNWLNQSQYWTTFANSSAEVAKGGPSVEEVVKSYNTYCGTEKLYTSKTDTTFFIGNTPNPTSNNSNNGLIDGEPYISETNYNKAFGYWLSSESDKDTYRISYSGAFYYVDIYGYKYGVRPIVTLKPETILEKTNQTTGSYITYNIKQ